MQISPGYSPWFGLRLIANNAMSGPWLQTSKLTDRRTLVKYSEECLNPRATGTPDFPPRPRRCLIPRLLSVRQTDRQIHLLRTRVHIQRYKNTHTHTQNYIKTYRHACVSQVTPASTVVYSLPIHVLILDRYLKLLRHIADIIALASGTGLQWLYLPSALYNNIMS